MVSERGHDDVEIIAQYRGVETPTPFSLPDHCSPPWTAGSSETYPRSCNPLRPDLLLP